MDEDLPLIGPLRPDEQPQERRLACPAGPHEQDEFPFTDFDGDVGERRPLIIPFRHMD